MHPAPLSVFHERRGHRFARQHIEHSTSCHVVVEAVGICQFYRLRATPWTVELHGSNLASFLCNIGKVGVQRVIGTASGNITNEFFPAERKYLLEPSAIVAARHHDTCWQCMKQPEAMRVVETEIRHCVSAAHIHLQIVLFTNNRTGPTAMEICSSRTIYQCRQAATILCSATGVMLGIR